MTITTEADLKWTNIPVRGVIEGEPDGIFGGRVSHIGDASGGTAVSRLRLGPLIVNAPVDIIMKLTYATFVNTTNASDLLLAQMQMSQTTSDILFDNPGAGAAGGIRLGANILATATLGPIQTLALDPRQGIWTWPQKGDQTIYMLASTTNPGAGTFGILVVQGHYWYIGPRRIAAMSIAS